MFMLYASIIGAIVIIAAIGATKRKAGTKAGTHPKTSKDPKKQKRKSPEREITPRWYVGKVDMTPGSNYQELEAWVLGYNFDGAADGTAQKMFAGHVTKIDAARAAKFQLEKTAGDTIYFDPCRERLDLDEARCKILRSILVGLNIVSPTESHPHAGAGVPARPKRACNDTPPAVRMGNASAVRSKPLSPGGGGWNNPRASRR